MITIKLVTLDGVLMPERELTQEERKTVTSTLFDGINAIHYQGDEPIIINETINTESYEN